MHAANHNHWKCHTPWTCNYVHTIFVIGVQSVWKSKDSIEILYVHFKGCHKLLLMKIAAIHTKHIVIKLMSWIWLNGYNSNDNAKSIIDIKLTMYLFVFNVEAIDIKLLWESLTIFSSIHFVSMLIINGMSPPLGFW